MRLSPVFTAAATALAGLALAACDGQGTGRGQGDDGRTAEGEVRGGTISDAMLPLDSLESQSPPYREGSTQDGAAATSRDEGEAPAGEDGADGAAGDAAGPAQDTADEGAPQAAD